MIGTTREAAARGQTRGRIVIVVAAAVFAAASAAVAQPHVSALIGRWEVESTFNSLRIPEDWSIRDAPVTHELSGGSVLLSAVYDTPLDATPSARFLALQSSEGWEVVGGSPDGSTVMLRRGDLSLSLATLVEHSVRLEVARYR